MYSSVAMVTEIMFQSILIYMYTDADIVSAF